MIQNSGEHTCSLSSRYTNRRSPFRFCMALSLLYNTTQARVHRDWRGSSHQTQLIGQSRHILGSFYGPCSGSRVAPVQHSKPTSSNVFLTFILAFLRHQLIVLVHTHLHSLESIFQLNKMWSRFLGACALVAPLAAAQSDIPVNGQAPEATKGSKSGNLSSHRSFTRWFKARLGYTLTLLVSCI